MTQVRSTEKKRIEYVDILRGIGIFLVVLGHLEIPDLLHNYIYSFHMPLFFFLGGIVYKKRDIKYDVRRRFDTLIIPYFVWGVFYYMYYYAIDVLAGNDRSVRVQDLLHLLIGEYESIEYNKTLWFLPCFFVVTVLFNIIVCFSYKYFKKYYKIATALIVLGMGVVFLSFDFNYSVWGIKNAFKFIVFYGAGSLFSVCEDSICKIKSYIMNVVLVIALAMIHIILLVFFYNHMIIDTYFMPMVAIIAWVLTAIKFEKMLRFFRFAGVVSMDIMCTEDVATNVVQNISEHIFAIRISVVIDAVIVMILCLSYAYFKQWILTVIKEKVRDTK